MKKLRLVSSVYDHGEKIGKMQNEKYRLEKLVSPRESSFSTRASTMQYFAWRHFFEVNGISFIFWSMIKIIRGF